MPARRQFCAALAVGVTTGCLRLAGNGTRTASRTGGGRNASTETASPTPEASLELEQRWRRSLDARHLSVGADYVYAAGDGVRALDPRTGEQAWYNRLGGSVNRTDAFTLQTATIVPSSRVFAIGADGPMEEFALYALDRSGSLVADQKLSTYPQALVDAGDTALLDTAPKSKHEVSNEGVTDYCKYGGGRIRSLSGDLSTNWTIEKPNEICGALRVWATGDVVLHNTDMYFRGLRPGDGHLWKESLEVEHVATDGNEAYVSTYDGVRRIDAVRGTPRWVYQGGIANGGEHLAADIALGPDQLFVHGAEFGALARDNSALQWRTSVPGNRLAGPLVTDRAVWTVTTEGLFAADPTTGALLHESNPELGSGNDARAFVTDGAVFVKRGSTLARFDVREA